MKTLYKKIFFTIDDQDPYLTTLIGKSANFIFNPNTRNGEELTDFLSGCEEINPQTEKEKMVNFHIEVMKQGLIEEGDKKWTDAYLPKIRETAEKYYDKLNNL